MEKHHEGDGLDDYRFVVFLCFPSGFLRPLAILVADENFRIQKNTAFSAISARAPIGPLITIVGAHFEGNHGLQIKDS